METGLRRSKRIRAKEESNPNSNLKSRSNYIQHINTLHDVTGDLLTMTDTLSEQELKRVIRKYENLIGDLLRIE
jgi:hypothetical protein|tara:strand:+ start:166 stop:387 length:222 start_codon:yes stop_codon:yes gene_type:complete